MPSKIVLALAAVAAAQTTTLEIFVPMLEGGLHATVIGVEGSTTTLGISCPEGATSDECGLPGPNLFTYIGSPTTMSWSYENEELQLSMSGHCDLDTAAVCTGAAAAGGDEMMTDVETVDNWKTWLNTVTVTAGAEKLTAAGDGPTKTSSDGPSETGSGSEEEGEGEGDDEGDDDDNSGTVQLACGSLLGAAAVAVGAVLI